MNAPAAAARARGLPVATIVHLPCLIKRISDDTHQWVYVEFGMKVAADGGDGETSETWQSATIDASAISATLTYWYAIGSEDWCGYDDGGLEVNASPAPGHAYDLCADTDTGDGWLQSASLDLSSHAGTSPEIRFVTTTDTSYPSSLFIDDVTLEVCVPGAPDGMFTDGFESGDTSGWSATSQ